MSATAGGHRPIRAPTTNRAEEQRIVLVTDNGSLIQMTQEHARIEPISRHNLLMSIWATFRDRALRTAAALWIDLPKSSTPTGNRNDRIAAARIVSYLDLAEEMGIPTAIFGNRRHHAWGLEVLQRKLAGSWRVSYHHHCAWGAIHGRTGQPQLGRTCIRATFKIADTSCPHASHDVHMADLTDGDGDAEVETRGHNRDRLAHGLVATLIKAMAGETSTVVATTTTRRSTTPAREPGKVRFQDASGEGEPVTGHSSDGLLEKMIRAPVRSVKTATQIRDAADTDTCPHMLADQPQGQQSLAERCVSSPAGTYPTDSKERRKELEKKAKQEGREIAVRKKKRSYDNVKDDCGDVLDGLDEDTKHYIGFDLQVDEIDELNCHEFAEDSFDHPRWFVGAEAGDIKRDLHNTLYFDNVHALIAYQTDLRSQPVVCEIAGGTARTSRILLGVRRRVGRNFDLACGINLLIPKERSAFLRYRAMSRVKVVIMSPPCSRFGGWSHLNRQIYADTWQARRHDDEVIAAFCGEVALAQFADQLDWLLEQPAGSDMLSVRPWPTVMQDERTQQVIFDQCQCGAKTKEGYHILKPTRATASSEHLLYYLRDLRCGTTRMCDGHHMQLTGKRADDAKIWPWMLARRIAWGIMRLTASQRGGSATAGAAGRTFSTALSCVQGANLIENGGDHHVDDDTSLFPGVNRTSTTAIGVYPARSGLQAEDDRSARRCPGCARHRPQDHEQHSREQGVCRYPHIQSVIYPCVGCRRDLPRHHPNHTLSTRPEDRCRVGCMQRNEPGNARGRVASGPRPAEHHRRDPREPAPAGEPEGQREARPAEVVDEADATGKLATASVPPPGGGLATASAAAASRDPQGSGEARPQRAPPEHEHGEGRIRPPRVRDQRGDLQPEGDEDTGLQNYPDLGRMMRLLHDRDDACVRKVLRRLHLRWYHATIAQMNRLLRMAGAPSSALKLVDEIVHTCRICRTWAKHAPDTKVATRMSTRFNAGVQGDLLFYADAGREHRGDHIILHLIDECIKWTVAIKIADKETATILEAMTEHWVRQFGAPEILVWDGEGALNSDEAKTWATRWCIDLVIRPAEKKAWIAERHHEILRDQLHKVQLQALADGLQVSFRAILSEATLAKNSLLSTGDGSPYVSLYGRVPRLLPQIEDIIGEARQDDTEGTASTRHVHRLREISVASAVEAMAQRRLKLAEKSRTALAGEQLNLHNGDQVEVYRKPANKDRPAWIGPATVVDTTELEHGKVTVKWQGRHLTVPLEAVRRALMYLTDIVDVVYPMMPLSTGTEPLRWLIDCVEGLQLQALVIGLLRSEAGWTFTADTKKHSMIYNAGLYVAAHHLGLSGCLSITVAKGIKVLHEMSNDVIASVTMHWLPGRADEMMYFHLQGHGEVRVERDLERRDWQKVCLVQFRLFTEQVVKIARQDNEYDHPMMGGETADVISDEIVRTPITLSPGGSADIASEIVDGVDIDVPGTPPGEDLMTDAFWEAWLAEIKASEKEERESKTADSQSQHLLAEEAVASLSQQLLAERAQQRIEDLERQEQWAEVQELSEGPDPTYHLQAFDLGFDHAVWLDQLVPPEYPMTPAASNRERQRSKLLHDMHLKQDAGLIWLIDTINELPAELEMPVEVAYMSGLVDRDALTGDVCYNSRAVMKIDKHGVKSTLIESSRSQNNVAVTDDDVRSNPKIVAAAILAELMRWIENSSFKRKMRRYARNTLSSRYVLTWKRQPTGGRLMKCRLCVRGFLDRQRDDMDRYSGTSTRWGQRAVVAVAVQQGWNIASLDIAMAFLRGMSFDEIQEARGGPRREVHMELPKGRAGLEPSGSAILRQCEGFSDFNDATEVLEMLKGGFGLVDAPNLFTTRVDNILKKAGMFATKVDPKIYVLMQRARPTESANAGGGSSSESAPASGRSGRMLDLIVSAHMDDFKATGPDDKLNWLRDVLRASFGSDVKLEMSKQFIHTGIRHTISEHRDHVTLDQEEYAQSIKPLVSATLATMKDEDMLDDTLRACYLTLLGAAAWMLQTRMDMGVYISALQRVSHKPTAIHLKRLSRVIRYMQRQPRRLEYRALRPPIMLVGIGDSAFKMPDEQDSSPLVMRGYVWALASHRDAEFKLQVLEYVSSRQHHVCRGVWSAELHNQCDMADMGLILGAFFEELRYGETSSIELRKRREQGSYAMPLHMFTDSYSIYSYLRAAHLKFPAEKATYLHLAFLKELLDAKALRSLTWVDTRDMVCDGLTKGMADRTAIHRLMAGSWKLNHPCETFNGGETAKTADEERQPKDTQQQQQCQQLLAEERRSQQSLAEFVGGSSQKS